MNAMENADIPMGWRKVLQKSAVGWPGLACWSSNIFLDFACG